MKRTLVSIIITVHNLEKYLPACLDSVISQSYDELEIIVVDDGSTDSSGQACDEYANRDDRIIVIHQCNKGLCSARQSGLNIAKGDYICFIDGDDRIDTRYVEALIYAVIENDCKIAQCKVMRVPEGHTISNSGQAIEQVVFDMEDYYVYAKNTSGYGVLSLCDKIFHKSLFNNVEFSQLKNAMDLQTLCELVYEAQGRIVLVSRALYYYTDRNGSMSKRSTVCELNDALNGYWEAVEYWKVKSEIIYELFWNLWVELIFILLPICVDIGGIKSGVLNQLSLQLHLECKSDFALCNKHLSIPYNARTAYEVLENSKIVLYGFGYNGKRIYSQLKNMGIQILEIWDMRFKSHEALLDEIPLAAPHGGLSRDTLILITVKDELVSSQIKKNLCKLGYARIMDCGTLNGAMKYKIIVEYFPFLLQDR